MSSAPKQEPSPVMNSRPGGIFESMQEFLLAGAAERIHADVEKAKRMGLIDSQGRRIAKDLPEDMLPGAVRDFGG